jgi:hypothetical protein
VALERGSASLCTSLVPVPDRSVYAGHRLEEHVTSPFSIGEGRWSGGSWTAGPQPVPYAVAFSSACSAYARRTSSARRSCAVRSEIHRSSAKFRRSPSMVKCRDGNETSSPSPVRLFQTAKPTSFQAVELAADEVDLCVCELSGRGWTCGLKDLDGDGRHGTLSSRVARALTLRRSAVPQPRARESARSW